MNYAIIGAAGFVAPRHLKAIKETHGDLLAAVDKSDSVGVLDSYFPLVPFFTEIERFDRHLDKLKRAGTNIDYLVVCSPNYLHDAHIRYGLRMGMNVICEKPLVVMPRNIAALLDHEAESERKVSCILQLRLHPELIALREFVRSWSNRREVTLTYITPRGPWYHASWKGDETKSGGIICNIGIHLFDMLLWIFGQPLSVPMVHRLDNVAAAGRLVLERGSVNWYLSTSNLDKPLRQIVIEGKQPIEFSNGFADLHTESYRKILNGLGFSIGEASKAIWLTHQIRGTEVRRGAESAHPFAGG